MVKQQDRTSSQEEERLIEYRFENLRRAGFGFTDARILSRAMWVDWREAAELKRNGCPAHLILEIVL